MNQYLVQCANCRKSQPDQGVRATCNYCGCSPLPSYDYPADSSFYPRGTIHSSHAWADGKPAASPSTHKH